MNNNIDMGNMTSKQIGDLMSKNLVERGKEMAKILYPNVDYGDLPSKTLTELGEQNSLNGKKNKLSFSFVENDSFYLFYYT